MNSIKSKKGLVSLKKQKFKRKISEILQDKPHCISSDEESNDDTELEERVEEENDDLVVTKVQYNFVDPVTKTKIVDPIKNKICNHIYEKTSILQIIRTAVQNGKKVRCPYIGCIATKFGVNHLIVDEETENIKKSLAAKNAISDDLNHDGGMTEQIDLSLSSEVIDESLDSFIGEISSPKSFAVKIIKWMESMQTKMKSLEKELQKVKTEGCGLFVCRRNDIENDMDIDSGSVNEKMIAEDLDGSEIFDKQNLEEKCLGELGDKDSSNDCSENDEDNMQNKNMNENENDEICDEKGEALRDISVNGNCAVLPSTNNLLPPSTNYPSPPTTNFSAPPTTNFKTEPSTNYSAPPTTNYSAPPATIYKTEPTTNYTNYTGLQTPNYSTYSGSPTTNYMPPPTTSYATLPATNKVEIPTSDYSGLPTSSAAQPSTNYTSQPTTTTYAAQPSTNFTAQPPTTYATPPITSYTGLPPPYYMGYQHPMMWGYQPPTLRGYQPPAMRGYQPPTTQPYSL